MTAIGTRAQVSTHSRDHASPPFPCTRAQTPRGAKRAPPAAPSSNACSSAARSSPLSTASFGTSTRACRRARRRRRCLLLGCSTMRLDRRRRRRLPAHRRRFTRRARAWLTASTLVLIATLTPSPLCRAQDAEQCIPLPRLADFGLDLGVDAVEGAPMEERASCLFVRRIAEERRRASACFSRVATPFPPYEPHHSNHKPL